MAAGRLFISYRRDDSKYAAKLIYERLAASLGRQRLFMDVASIAGGIDYQRTIRETISTCDVCVAIVGEKWSSASDAAGARRLDDPNDLLRLEIATALGLEDVRVIPCVLDGAVLPSETELPEQLRPLATRQQIHISYPSFDRDMVTLIKAIREAFAVARRRRRLAIRHRWKRRLLDPITAFARRKPVIGTALALLVCTIVAGSTYVFGMRPLFSARMLLQNVPPEISKVSLPTRGSSYPSPGDWRDEVVYYVLPDRFSDGSEGQRPMLNPLNLESGRGPNWNGQAWLHSGAGRWQGGTLAGIGSKLDYLKGLGISTILLAPVEKQRPLNGSASYMGFSVQNFLDVDSHFGSRRDLVNLVSDAHRRNMRVILSAVLMETGGNWDYPANLSHNFGPISATQTLPFGYWLDGNGKPVAKPAGPDDGVWPRELQNPDDYFRAGFWNSFDKRGDFPGLRRLRFSKVSETMAACYRYWIALTDCDGLYLESLGDIAVEDAHTFCRLIKSYAATLGKRNFLIAGELLADENAQSQYLARLNGDLDAVLDIGARNLSEAAHGNAPASEYFKEFDSSQSPMAAYRYEGKRTLLMIANSEGLFGRSRFSAGSTTDHQIAAAAAVQLLTPGVPCLYYGDEQAFGIEPGTVEALRGGYGSVQLREAMFGPVHPRRLGREGRQTGSAGLDTTLPGFGPFGTSGQHAFNPNHPAYRRIAVLTTARRKYAPLRTGSLGVRPIRSPGGAFHDSAAAEIVAWTRSMGAESLMCIVNLNGLEQRDADVSVDLSLTRVGSEFTVVANTMQAAEGQGYKGTHPVTSRLPVKSEDGGGAYIEIRGLGPSEALILAGKPVDEDTDFGRVAIQYQRNPYGFGSSSYYQSRKRR